MLSGEGNENGEKNNYNRSNYQKSNFHVQHTFFVHYFCRCFARIQRETSRNILVTRFVGETSCSCSLFFHCRSFPPRWSLAFLIFTLTLQNFMFFLQQKMSPLFFLSRSCFFSRWASLACRLTFSFLCLSLSLFSKFVDMTINLSLIL